jgi:hypothetical protein
MLHRTRLYADTSAEAERVLLAIYGRMPIWCKIELIEDANRTARHLAMVGLRSRTSPTCCRGQIHRFKFGQPLR